MDGTTRWTSLIRPRFDLTIDHHLCRPNGHRWCFDTARRISILVLEVYWQVQQDISHYPSFAFLAILIMSFNDSGDWSLPTTVRPSDLHAPLPSGHPYDSLVPPSTTLTPGDLLRNHHHNRGTLDRADPSVLRIQMEVHRNHPENAALPIGSTGLIGRWKRPNGLPAELVPVHGVEPILDRSQAVVEFRDRDQEGPSSGTLLHYVRIVSANTE